MPTSLLILLINTSSLDIKTSEKRNIQPKLVSKEAGPMEKVLIVDVFTNRKSDDYYLLLVLLEQIQLGMGFNVRNILSAKRTRSGTINNSNWKDIK